MLEKLANGINPIDGSAIMTDHLLNKPHVIRHLFTILHFLDSELERKDRNRYFAKRG